MCRHTVVDLAQVFHSAPAEAVVDRLPPADYERLRASLTESGMKLLAGPAADKKLAKLRSMYEPYLQTLADFLCIDLPPWIQTKQATDNWKTTAWGRIAGFSAPAEKDAAADDH